MTYQSPGNSLPGVFRSGLGILIVIGACWVSARPVFAQVNPAVTGSGGLIIADRFRTRLLRDAQDLIAKENYRDGLSYLQSLSELEQDQLLRPGSDDASQVFRSMKAEIQSIIGHLPPDGRAMYLASAAPVAKALLGEALEKNDEAKLSLVASQYFHTPAGYQATFRLGLRKLDHGEPLLAALLLRKLQKTPEAAKLFEPRLSLLMTLCWMKARMSAEADTGLAKLKASDKAMQLQFAGESRPLFDSAGKPAEWLAKLANEDGVSGFARKSDWLLPRVELARNPVLPMPKPAEMTPWQTPTVVDPYTKEPQDLFETPIDQTLKGHVKTQRSLRSRQSQHMIPSQQPLVINGMVISRMLEPVRAFDLETGEFILQWFCWNKALERLTDAEDKPPNADAYLAPLVNQLIWEDRANGQLCSDGERLYCIEDTGFWRGIPPHGEKPAIPTTSTNILLAFDLHTGKLLWDVGGPPGEDPRRSLPGRFFLGAPLPMAGKLYCLVEHNNEIQLNALDAESGRLEWSQPLASTSALSITQDLARRTSGVSVAYAEGVMVCPTDVGSTVALDLTTRGFLWGYPTEISGAFRQPNQPQFRRRAPQPKSALPKGWLDSTPTIHRDKVLLTPLKSSRIYLLDLRTGERIWDQPRGDGLYVAGVIHDMAIVVGRTNVQTWSLLNDQTGWKDPLTLSASPTGQGLIVGSRLLLPAGNSILVVDLKQGKELASIPAPKDVELGNLVLAQGRLISQGVNTLNVIPFPKLDE